MKLKKDDSESNDGGKVEAENYVNGDIVFKQDFHFEKQDDNRILSH